MMSCPTVPLRTVGTYPREGGLDDWSLDSRLGSSCQTNRALRAVDVYPFAGIDYQQKKERAHV